MRRKPDPPDQDPVAAIKHEASKNTRVERSTVMQGGCGGWYSQSERL